MGTLTVTRKPGESVCIGKDIRVTFRRRNGKRAIISIEAPEGLRVMRSEVIDRERNRAATEAAGSEGRADG